MKNLLIKGTLFLVSFLFIYFGTQRPAEAKPTGVITFQTFYSELAPYGNWIQNADYGYVWVPNVGQDFWPYGTSGHWLMTEYGNTWISDYNWGWAPFHYGRWLLDDYYGWIWVPGTEWAPAWVAWRSGGGYYGWAPLSPGININVSFNVGRYVPNNYWVFVNQGYFTRPSIYRYCVPHRNVVTVINHTTIINNTYVDHSRHTYYTGPRANDIERVTHQQVRVHRISQADRPSATVVRNGAVSVYRPQVERGNREVAPATSYNRNDSRSTPKSGNTYLEGRNRNQINQSSRNARSTGNQKENLDRNSAVKSGSSRTYQQNSTRNNTVKEKDNSNAIQRSGNSYSRENAGRQNSNAGNRNNSNQFNQSDNNRGNSGSNYSKGNAQKQMQPPANNRAEPVRKPDPQPKRSGNNSSYSNNSNNRSNNSSARSNQNYSQSRQTTPSRQPAVNRSQSPSRSQSTPQRQSQSRSTQGRETSRSRGNN